jgi:hypothetical protein
MEIILRCYFATLGILISTPYNFGITIVHLKCYNVFEHYINYIVFGFARFELDSCDNFLES